MKPNFILSFTSEISLDSNGVQELIIVAVQLSARFRWTQIVSRS